MTTTTTIFLFFLVACVGAAVGGLIQRTLEARKAKAAPPPPTDSQLAGEGDVEILRAWRAKAGKVWLEIDQSRIDDKDALRPDQRQKLLNLIIDLRPWLETASARPPLPSPTSPTTPVSRAPAAAGPVEPVSDNAKPKVNMKSIVEQIDDVLQGKLAGTVYESKEIHIVEGAGGAVTVQIDREKYDGVEAVPDPEIQALIRQAAADWEKGSK